jgi:hypothetical protein
MNGGTTEDAYNDTLLLLEAKLVLTNKGLHDFPKTPLTLPPAKMLCVNPQLVVELDYDRDVVHGYVDQNLPRLNILQETTVTTLFNVVAQGEGVIFFLDTTVFNCRNPTLAKCTGESQHSQSWGLGVLRDSRMFRARQ